jgi:hypothetical protein
VIPIEQFEAIRDVRRLDRRPLLDCIGGNMINFFIGGVCGIVLTLVAIFVLTL